MYVVLGVMITTENWVHHSRPLRYKYFSMSVQLLIFYEKLISVFLILVPKHFNYTYAP